MNTMFARWGYRLHWAGLLLFVNEFLFWQRVDTYRPLEWLPVIGLYGLLGWFTFDLIHRWRVTNLRGLLLVGGVFSLLQSTAITATFDYDLPISILLFGTGIGVVGFITAFGLWWLSYARQEWFNPLWVWAAYLLIGIASGLWIHGIAEAADLHWPNVDLATSVPVLVAGLIINGLTATVRPSSSHQEFKWRLGFWSWVIILLGIGTALIARIVNGTLSVGGLIIMMIVLVMVQLILWFETNLHKKTSSLLDTFEPDQHDRFVRMVVMSGPLLGGHLLGYWLSDTISSLNTLLFLGIVIFGAVWLPIISTQLGFKAFIQLVEEEMYS